jgi:hypothetical protein
LTNVIAIAGGGYHNLALKADRTVVAWGCNDYGQTDVPADLTNVVAVSGGNSCSMALKANGTIVAWGWNAYGQTNVSTHLTNVIVAAAGITHSLAMVGGPSVSPRLTGITSSNGSYHISVPTVRGGRYQLESTPSLSAPIWQAVPLPPIPGDDTIKTLSKTSASGPQRFYRVRKE